MSVIITTVVGLAMQYLANRNGVSAPGTKDGGSESLGNLVYSEDWIIRCICGDGKDLSWLAGILKIYAAYVETIKNLRCFADTVKIDTKYVETRPRYKEE